MLKSRLSQLVHVELSQLQEDDIVFHWNKTSKEFAKCRVHHLIPSSLVTVITVTGSKAITIYKENIKLRLRKKIFYPLRLFKRLTIVDLL